MHTMGSKLWMRGLAGPAELRFSIELALVRWGVTAIPLDLLLSLDDLFHAVMALCRG